MARSSATVDLYAGIMPQNIADLPTPITLDFPLIDDYDWSISPFQDDISLSDLLFDVRTSDRNKPVLMIVALRVLLVDIIGHREGAESQANNRQTK